MNDTKLIKEVETYFDLKKDLSERCKGYSAEIKVALAHFFRDNLGYKLEYIGLLFNHDHTSIMYLLRKPKNEATINIINEIYKSIK
jgi:hypothetical protein